MKPSPWLLVGVLAVLTHPLRAAHAEPQRTRAQGAASARRARSAAHESAQKPKERAQEHEEEQPAATGAGDEAPAASDAPQAPPPPTAPKPSEPSSETKKAAKTEDRAALQQELAQVMDELVQARERVAVLGKALFKTHVRLRLDNRTQDTQSVGPLVLSLDGKPVVHLEQSGKLDTERPLFEGFAAPGPHVLEVDAELRARGNDAYRYHERQSFRFEVVRDLRTDLRVVIDDDSDIAEDFQDDREGKYDVRTRLEVRAVKPSED